MLYATLNCIYCIMTSKQTCICITCGRGFTRKTSDNRHNLNLHSGISIIIETSLYYIRVLQCRYPIPDSSTAIRRKIVTPVIRNYRSNFNIDGKSVRETQFPQM